MKIIDKILRVAIATGLGVIFNKIFSSTNKVKVTDKLKENGKNYELKRFITKILEVE